MEAGFFYPVHPVYPVYFYLIKGEQRLFDLVGNFTGEIGGQRRGYNFIQFLIQMKI
jgi:hypothetical protein